MGRGDDMKAAFSVCTPAESGLRTFDGRACDAHQSPMSPKLIVVGVGSVADLRCSSLVACLVAVPDSHVLWHSLLLTHRQQWPLFDGSTDKGGRSTWGRELNGCFYQLDARKAGGPLAAPTRPSPARLRGFLSVLGESGKRFIAAVMASPM